MDIKRDPKIKKLSASFWTYSFAMGCCTSEINEYMDSEHNIRSLLNLKPNNIEQSDLLLVSGAINKQNAKYILDVYNKMREPKWVIAIGACAISGGIFKISGEVLSLKEILPVDLFLPGCPPSKEAIVEAIKKLEFAAKSQV